MLLRRHKNNNVKMAQKATLTDFDIEEKQEESEAIVYSKTDINRMNVESLKELAKKSGLTVGEEESGSSLKLRLIELLVK